MQNIKSETSTAPLQFQIEELVLSEPNLSLKRRFADSGKKCCLIGMKNLYDWTNIW